MYQIEDLFLPTAELLYVPLWKRTLCIVQIFRVTVSISQVRLPDIEKRYKSVPSSGHSYTLPWLHMAKKTKQKKQICEYTTVVIFMDLCLN